MNDLIIEIRINYLDTLIQINRENNILNVFVKAPQRLLHSVLFLILKKKKIEFYNLKLYAIIFILKIYV